MNTRIRKIAKEIEALETKITAHQERIKTLRKEQVELENIEIIGAIRSAKIPLSGTKDIVAALRKYHDNKGNFHSQNIELKGEKNEKIEEN